MRYRITDQIPPLAAPGTRVSAVNRAFNAALGELLERDGGAWYDGLYARYMGIAPRFRPRAADCDPWPEASAEDLAALLERGSVRFGYIPTEPYVYMSDGRLTGFDLELGTAVAEAVSLRYSGRPGAVAAEWVQVAVTGDDQADHLGALAKGLEDGDFDVALSGQMMLPADYVGDLPIEWTAPTALLFTAISYTGRDRDLLDLAGMAALRSGDLPAFQAYAVAESRRLNLELRIFSVMNPGPSPGAATSLVHALHAAGGRAVWDTGDVADSDRVMMGATDHFAVGDSLASGMQAARPGFGGTYLNVPAADELWPIAGFTLGAGVTPAPHFAVFAEHSDAKKPMVLDPTLPGIMQGWNVRIFNRVEALRGSSIGLESGTGVVSLAPGLYRITATSLVTYDDMAAPGKVTTDAEPYAGYSRLRYAQDAGCGNEDAICVGSIATANMVPSTLEAYLEVKESVRIVLEHQVGNRLSHLYLQGIWENSSWHVFARLAIHKL